MTYLEKLYSMKHEDLIKEADRKNIEVKCNTMRTKLREDREDVIKRLVSKTEEQLKRVDDSIKKGMEVLNMKPEIDFSQMPSGDEADNATFIEEEKTTITPKRGQLIEYNGKSQNLSAWSKELGISPNTLYNRLYTLKWTIERAFGYVKS